MSGPITAMSDCTFCQGDQRVIWRSEQGECGRCGAKDSVDLGALKTQQPSPTDQMRADFETTQRAHFGIPDLPMPVTESGKYHFATDQRAWDAWQQACAFTKAANINASGFNDGLEAAAVVFDECRTGCFAGIRMVTKHRVADGQFTPAFWVFPTAQTCQGFSQFCRHSGDRRRLPARLVFSRQKGGFLRLQLWRVT